MPDDEHGAGLLGEVLQQPQHGARAALVEVLDHALLAHGQPAGDQLEGLGGAQRRGDQREVDRPGRLGELRPQLGGLPPARGGQRPHRVPEVPLRLRLGVPEQHEGVRHQIPIACTPPSACTISPVVAGSQSEHSATTVRAVGSASVTSQPSGARSPQPPSTWSKPGMEVAAVVRIGPAETRLTRMPSRAEVAGEVAGGGLEGGLGHAHPVVDRPREGGVEGQPDDGRARAHQRLGGRGEGLEREGGDLHRRGHVLPLRGEEVAAHDGLRARSRWSGRRRRGGRRARARRRRGWRGPRRSGRRAGPPAPAAAGGGR